MGQLYLRNYMPMGCATTFSPPIPLSLLQISQTVRCECFLGPANEYADLKNKHVTIYCVRIST